MYICITGSDNNKDVYIKQSIESQTVKHLPVSIENWENTMIYLSSFPVILTN